MIFRHLIIALLVSTGISSSVFASEYGDLKMYSAKAKFEDVKADVVSAIVNRGFVIDYHGFIGKMLKRTGKDIGSKKTIYKNAEFYQFCSAILSRRTMEADPRNIGYCPYVIVVYELASKPGTIQVGYRRIGRAGSANSKMALAAVEKTLDGIVREATQ